MNKFKFTFPGGPRAQAIVLGILILITGGFFVRSIQAGLSPGHSGEARQVIVPVTGVQNAQQPAQSDFALLKIDLSLLRQAIYDQITNPQEAQALYQRIEKSLQEPVQYVGPVAVAQAATIVPPTAVPTAVPTDTPIIIPTLTPEPTPTPSNTAYHLYYDPTATNQPNSGGETRPKKKSPTPVPTEPPPTEPPPPPPTEPPPPTVEPPPTEPPPPGPTIAPTTQSTQPPEGTPPPRPTHKPKPTKPAKG